MIEVGYGQIQCQEPNYAAKDVSARILLTVEENINGKITNLQEEIYRLEKSKATLGPLLKMKIQDIREAMNY